MNFVRPEVRATLWRWREVLIGAVITALGANWAFTSFGVLAWLGWPTLIVGFAFLVMGLQRARVRPRSGGAGLVELDEAQLSYFLPEGGVIVPLSQVVRIEIVTGSKSGPGGGMYWQFTGGDGSIVLIPAAAAGAERLLDALSHFPGASYTRVIEASTTETSNSFVIWQKTSQKNIRRLH